MVLGATLANLYGQPRDDLRCALALCSWHAALLPPAGEGDDAALLAAARAEHERHAKLDQRAQELAEQRQLQQQARSERSARVAQLLRDNGLPSFYTFSVASIAYYIETGEGRLRQRCEATCFLAGSHLLCLTWKPLIMCAQKPLQCTERAVARHQRSICIGRDEPPPAAHYHAQTIAVPLGCLHLQARAAMPLP